MSTTTRDVPPASHRLELLYAITQGDKDTHEVIPAYKMLGKRRKLMANTDYVFFFLEKMYPNLVSF